MAPEALHCLLLLSEVTPLHTKKQSVIEQSKVYLWAKLSVKTSMKDGRFVVVSLHKKYLVVVQKKTFTTYIIYSKTLEIKLLYIHTNKQAAS